MIKKIEEYRGYELLLNTRSKRVTIKGCDKMFINVSLAKAYIDKEL